MKISIFLSSYYIVYEFLVNEQMKLMEIHDVHNGTKLLLVNKNDVMKDRKSLAIYLFLDEIMVVSL